jgi:hypothetical protein
MAKKLRDTAFELAGARSAPDDLLESARQLFGERGFSGARIARGSCYWPVPVDELFVNLWQDHTGALAAAASTAVTQAGESGVTDPGKLFEAGGRAFLEGSWLRRDLVLLFASGDAPQGFTSMRQLTRRAWLRRNTKLLCLGNDPEDRLHAATLTSLIGNGERAVAAAPDFRQAQIMIDAVIGYARLLVADRPRPTQHYAGLPGARGLGSTLSS